MLAAKKQSILPSVRPVLDIIFPTILADCVDSPLMKSSALFVGSSDGAL